MVLPPMISPVDMRNIGMMCRDFGLVTNLLPDYSDTLDGGIWKEYQLIPAGGTPLSVIQGIGSSRAVVELGAGCVLREAGKYISETFPSQVTRMELPVGVKATDNFIGFLSTLSGKDIPDSYTKAREQLIDAYVDGHKYVFEKKAIISGDEDTVAAVVALCTEIGITPVILASSSGTRRLKLSIADLLKEKSDDIAIVDEADMDTIELMCKDNKPDLCIGTSKCYTLSRKLGIPLVRVGFPVHDRFGAARIAMTGYNGTISLLDKIVNALLEHKQENNDIGYSYL
jgi:nitrogenase molybdenum-iron protein NifN